MPFTSVEHILSQSLGNPDDVLPVGVVCDPCNHGVLSSLDAALAGFLPIELMRTANAIPTKRGKLPWMNFDNGSLECQNESELALALDSRRWTASKPAPPGRKAFSFTAQRHDATPKKLALVQRALLKIAVEFSWRDEGPEHALGADYDHAREKVLRGGQSGYIVLGKVATPSEEVHIHYQRAHRTSDGHPMVMVVARFWGVLLVTDSLFREPVRELPDGLLLLTFN